MHYSGKEVVERDLDGMETPSEEGKKKEKETSQIFTAITCMTGGYLRAFGFLLFKKQNYTFYTCKIIVQLPNSHVISNDHLYCLELSFYFSSVTLVLC